MNNRDSSPDTTRSRIRIALLTLGVMVVVIGGVGGFWHYRFGVPAKVDVFTRANDLTAELSDGLPFDSPDNAVVHYRDAFDALAHTEAWERWKERNHFDVLSTGAWDDPRTEQARSGLAALRPSLLLLDRAADAPGYRPRYSASGDVFHPSDTGPEADEDMIVIPHLDLFRRIGEVNAAAVRATANERDWDDLVRRVRTGVRHGRHVARDPFAMMALVGYTVEVLVYFELRHAALEQQLPAAVCDRLLDELDAVDADPTLAPHMRGEAAIFPGIVRVMMRQHIDYASPLTPEFWRRSLQLPPASATLRDADRYFKAMERYVDQPYADRAAAAPPDPGAAAWIVPDFAVRLEVLDALNTDRAATRIVLLLEKHHALTGEWPDALEDIMPLDDTLEPNTLEPFVYTRTPEGPVPFTLRAPDAAAAFLSNEEHRDFAKPRATFSNESSGSTQEE